jgi:hypothetical protein
MRCPSHGPAAIVLLAGLTSLLVNIPSGAQVGFTIQLGQPGSYGPVSPAGMGLNQLLYPQPVVGQLRYVIRAASVQPLYLRVPPGQTKNWRTNCQRYGACDRNVYFVQESWYNQNDVQRYQQQNHGNRGRSGRNDHQP